MTTIEDTLINFICKSPWNFTVTLIFVAVVYIVTLDYIKTILFMSRGQGSQDDQDDTKKGP